MDIRSIQKNDFNLGYLNLLKQLSLINENVPNQIVILGGKSMIFKIFNFIKVVNKYWSI